MTPQEIISDEEIARVHAHANFGAMSPREVVNEGVRKTAVGYHCGSTQLHILLEHGLATKPRPGSSDVSLTKKGKAYARSIYRVTTPAADADGIRNIVQQLIIDVLSDGQRGDAPAGLARRDPAVDQILSFVTVPAADADRVRAATGAEAVIHDEQIVISIDVDALPGILSGSIATNSVAGFFKVTDPAVFAKEVCRALNAEKEDGTTRVHMMFDSAFNHAIDQGAEGVEEVTEDEFEAEAQRIQSEALAALKSTDDGQAAP